MSHGNHRNVALPNICKANNDFCDFRGFLCEINDDFSVGNQ